MKTTKHIGLAFSMKNDLRAKTHISALNRRGTCSSYDDLMRIDTKWANDILEEGDEYATLPSNVKPDIFSQVAFDNADYGQDKNLQHITDTGIYQYPNGSFSEDAVTYVTERKKKNRRRSVSTSPSKPVNFEPDATKIPEYYKNVCLEELKCGELSNKRITMNHINKAWVLSRMVSAKYFSLSDVAVIPEWTPFHKAMSSNLNFPAIIGNCRSYPAPPSTSMTNVYTVLLNIKKMLNKTGMTSYIVSCDEAVYQIWKEIHWKTKTNLTTWYSVWEVSTLQKISLALLENEWTEVDLVRYWKTRHRMVPPRLKVMCNLSFSRELSFFSGHHPHFLSIVE